MADSRIQILDNASVTKLMRAFQNSVGGFTVDNEAVTLVDSAGNPVSSDPTFSALRVTNRPFEVLGVYGVGEITGAYSSIAAGGELFQFRWTDATKLAVILRVSVSVSITAAATAAGIISRQLKVARAWSASGSGGTQIVTTGDNLKRRQSFPSSVAGDIRIASTAALGAGTKTFDANGCGIAATGIGTAAITAYTSNVALPKQDLYNVSAGGIGEYPIVLKQNEGCSVLMPDVEPTSATLKTSIDFIWAEVASF